MRCIATIVASCLLAGASSAATITVNPDGSGDYTTIQAAIDAAETSDVIQIAAATYNEVLMITKAIHLEGAGIDQTILNPPLEGTSDIMKPGIRFVDLQGTPEDCSVSGMTIANFGRDISGQDPQPQGGGIGCYEANVCLMSVRIQHNFDPSVGGGGVYMIRSKIKIKDSAITGNETRSVGAGIYMAPHGACAMGTPWGLEIDNCQITENTITNNGSGSQPVSPNTGGGIYLPASTCGGCGCPSYSFRMTNSLVQANKITGLSGDPSWQPTGAGIYFETLALPDGWNPTAIENPIMITNTVIRNNSGQSGLEATPVPAEIGIGGQGSHAFASIMTPWIGGCCVGDSCVNATKADCEMAGGTYAGDGMLCCCIQCEDSCSADTDNDGAVNVQDILNVIESWGYCP